MSIHVAMAMVHTLAKQPKKTKFVLFTCLLPFMVNKGSGVLEKKVNETQVLKLCSATLTQK